MAWDDEEACNTRLTLRVGIRDFYKQVHPGSQNDNKDKPLSLARQHFSFPLHGQKEKSTDDAEQKKRINGFGIGSSSSRVFADSDNFKAKFKDHSNGNQQGNNISRKKLRLSEEQSTMLENSFSFRNILSPAQKKALAEELNLQPRQVEVWFQNRRARTKVKQTEVDCELLKKRCQSLIGENRQLNEELEELRCLMKLQPQSPRQPTYAAAFVRSTGEGCRVPAHPAGREQNISEKARVVEGGLDVDGAS